MKKYFTAALVLIGGQFCVGVATANQVNAVLSNFVVADYLLGKCGAAIFPDTPESEIRASYDLLRSSLADRAVRLRPGLTRKKAAESIRSTVESRTAIYAASLDKINCDRRKVVPTSRFVQISAGSKFRRLTEKLPEAPVYYEKQRQVNSDAAGPVTFAYPDLLRNLLQAMSQRGGGGHCSQLTVEKIEFVSKTKHKVENLPIFLLPPIEYIENWTTRCGDDVKVRRVQFVLDSDGPVGRTSYRIEVLN